LFAVGLVQLQRLLPHLARLVRLVECHVDLADVVEMPASS
jgi:hypothetical protein